jgi:hypothetical protein
MGKIKSQFEAASDKADRIKPEDTESTEESRPEILTSEEATRITKVRNVIPSNMLKVERIWAEDGTVRILTKDGREKMFPWQEAAERCRELIRMNQKIMVLNTDLKESHFELIEKITKACHEAKSQAGGHFKSKKTEQVQNFINHRDIKGRPIDDTAFNDRNMEHYLQHYHKLESWEIENVLKSNYPSNMKKNVLKAMHLRRLQRDNFK